MPQVTLYVRKEDWEAFKAIKNKAEWLHNAITPPRPPIIVVDPKKFNKGFNMSPSSRIIEINPKSHTYMDPDQLP